MKRIHWFEAALALTIMAAHIYAALSEAHNFPTKWFTRDDAYFYFKTAQNLSEGLGSTFDGINPTNGYHPLWLLVCIPIFSLARFDLILPLRLLVVLMGMLSAASGIILFRLLKRVVFEPIAMLAAAYWVFNTYIHETVTQFGLETGLLTFSVLLLLRRVQIFEDHRQKDKRSKDVLVLALLATMVFLSRLDMIFLSGLVGIWMILRGTPLRYFLITDALVTLTSVLLGFVLRLGFPHYYTYAQSALVMAGSLLALRLPLLYLLGLDDSAGIQKPLRVLIRTALVVVVSSSLTGLFLSILGERVNGFPRSVILLEAGLSLVLLSAIRLGAVWFRPNKEAVAWKLEWPRLVKEAFIFYGVLGGTLAAYMLFNLISFGTPTPVSGQVKRWWGAPINQVRGGPAGTLEAFLGVDRNGDFNAWPQVTSLAEHLARQISTWSNLRLRLPQVYLPVLAALAILTFTILLAKRRRSLRAVQRLGLLPLFAGCGFQIFSYNATGYSAVKEWYWAGQMLFTLLLAALLLDLLLPRWLKDSRVKQWNLALATLIGLIWFGRLAQDIYYSMPLQRPNAGAPYVEAAAVLEKHTEPGSLIGVTGGGSLGYFIHERGIVNMDGLINSPAYFKAMQAGQAADYLDQNGVDYIFANPDILLKLAPFKTQFKGRLIRLGITYGGKELMKIRPSSP